MVFVGLDWASTAHAVCVLDPIGTVRWRGSVPHSADGLAELVRRPRQCGAPATVHVAIEAPRACSRHPDERRRPGRAHPPNVV